MRAVETVVYEKIVCFGIGIFGKVVADEVAPVVVFIVTVVAARSIGIECCVVIGGEETDFVYSLRCIVHIDDFEATIFVAGREDECLIVDIFDMSRTDIGRLHERYTVVRAAVLIDIGFDFSGGVYHLAGVIADGE